MGLENKMQVPPKHPPRKFEFTANTYEAYLTAFPEVPVLLALAMPPRDRALSFCPPWVTGYLENEFHNQVSGLIWHEPNIRPQSFPMDIFWVPADRKHMKTGSKFLLSRTRSDGSYQHGS
jgi:hypothetical protein